MGRAAERPAPPTLQFEFALANEGCQLIAGLDEAGRGAWAGPVVAAAVILPLEMPDLRLRLSGVRDSKQMTARQRERWAQRIREVAIGVAIGEANAAEVDAIGLMKATRNAMQRAIQALPIAPDHLLIDHLLLPEISLPQTAITKGDVKVLSIASASIIAKVTRDSALREFDARYPGYGFAAHKGYGTRQHRAALEQLAPSPIHRYSYAPVAACLSHRTPAAKPGKRPPRLAAQ